MLLTIEGTASEALREALAAEERKVAHAFLPCAYVGGEYGAQSTEAWLAAHGRELSAAQTCLALTMRVFFAAAAWVELVETPDCQFGRGTRRARI